MTNLLPASLIITFDSSSGATFGYPLILDEGILGTNVLADSATTVVDISDQVQKVDIRGNYNLLAQQFDAGTCTVRVLDNAGDWNPQNAASPYFPLVPLRKLRVSSEFSGVVYTLFSGYVSAYNYTYSSAPEQVAYVDIVCSEAFRLYNLANLTTVTGAVAGDTTGVRLGLVLDEVGWPSSMRQISTTAGQTTCQADQGTSRTALSTVKNLEFTEQGAFYIDNAGDAVFKSRIDVMQASGANPTVFNQTGGINYASLVYAFDDKLIINDALITRTGGAVQESFDQTSIDTFFQHSLTQAGLSMQTDAEALSLAQMYVASRKNTTIRIDSITLNLMTSNYSAGIIAALNMQILDTVTITSIQPAGSTITKTLQVMAVDHSITPSTWLTTFTTSEPIIDGFILDSTLYGILDTSVLAY